MRCFVRINTGIWRRNFDPQEVLLNVRVHKHDYSGSIPGGVIGFLLI